MVRMKIELHELHVKTEEIQCQREHDTQMKLAFYKLSANFNLDLKVDLSLFKSNIV